MKDELSPLVESIREGIEKRKFFVLLRENACQFEAGQLEEIAQHNDWAMDWRDGNVLYRTGGS